MKKVILIIFILLLFIINGIIIFGKEKETKKEPIPFILDMDFSSDVDDVCALRLANNLHKSGVIELKAIMLSTSDINNMNLKAVNGLLNYDGIKNIQIGYSHQFIQDNSPYWNILTEYFDQDNYFISDSVYLYRYIIVNSDKPVTICTTGYLNNIADLLQSPPDFISPLSGKELLKENNTKIYITGGEPDGWSNNLSFYEESREATDYIINNIEGLHFIQSDTGGAYVCGDNLQINEKYKDDPVTKSLWAFNGCPCGRFAWDPTAVWIASIQDYKYCNMNIESINVEYNKESGYNKFIITENGIHYRIYRQHTNFDFYKNIINNLIIPQ